MLWTVLRGLIRRVFLLLAVTPKKNHASAFRQSRAQIFLRSMKSVHNKFSWRKTCSYFCNFVCSHKNRCRHRNLLHATVLFVCNTTDGSHLDEYAVEHVGEAPLPCRRQHLQAQAFDIRASVGHGTEQVVVGVQAELLQHLLNPDEQDVGQLFTAGQVS